MDEDDQANAVWAAQNGVDFLGLSFVPTDDVHQPQSLIASYKAETGDRQIENLRL